VYHGEIYAIAIFERILRQSRLAQETFERLGLRTAARALDFLADRGGRMGKLSCNECKTARRGPDGQLAGIKAGCAELRPEQPCKLGARSGLHPGGDFFAAQFKEEIGHSVHPGYCAVQRSDWLSIHALQLPFARSRTRAM